MEQIKQYLESFLAWIKTREGQILAGITAVAVLVLIALLKIKNPFQKLFRGGKSGYVKASTSRKHLRSARYWRNRALRRYRR